jgi:hypothetical protein
MIMIHDLSKLDRDTDEAVQLMNTLSFAYVSTTMPKYAFTHLQRNFQQTLEIIRAGKQPLEWLHLQKVDFPLYIQVLEMWTGPALETLTNAEVITMVTESMSRRRFSEPEFMSRTPIACKKEKLLYIHAAMPYPSKRSLQTHEPELLELLEKHSARPKANADRFKDYVCSHWHVNTTLVDPEWHAYLDDPEREYDLSHDPFEFINRYYSASLKRPEGASCLYDYVSVFFLKVASAIKHLNGRLQVESVHGDFVDLCERVRFGVYNKEDLGEGFEAAFVRPKDFPTFYDRIHMSNVPYDIKCYRPSFESLTNNKQGLYWRASFDLPVRHAPSQEVSIKSCPIKLLAQLTHMA